MAGIIAGVLMLWASGVSAQAQQTGDKADPRTLALDIFQAVKRQDPPASIARDLTILVRLFRFRCSRLTDFQTYEEARNRMDFKIKCSGSPLYGVTVASNGYVSVYGGNGIINGLDRRDGLIYSFAADGVLAGDSALGVDEAVEQSMARIRMGDRYSPAYLAMAMAVLFFILISGLLLWVRAWRQRSTDKLAGMHLHYSVASAFKDQLLRESRRVIAHVYRHPEGFYIVRGKHGKRRFFGHLPNALLYRMFGWKLFELRHPPHVREDESDDRAGAARTTESSRDKGDATSSR
ncbi:hypothetical protein [Yunchengibacter salinarum]|uniref:hypothetical protein n=1 Tax=Yunchengibacter salinarum TaxID=3133399 RepID=UPI0035B630C1